MTKNTSTALNSYFDEVNRHYDTGFQETDRRRTGRGRIGSISFDEADELFRSWIDEAKWPYDALLFDPRIFTFIFEKTARLLGGRLRGELVPREGSDVLGARINNEILNFQWDQANHDGSMLSKWALMDINTRKYGAAFGLCKWRYEEDKKGNVVFDGPEMKVLMNRDCASDGTATNIQTCDWFQVREYVTPQSLKQVNDAARKAPIYQNLDKLIEAVGSGNGNGGDSRSTNWISRNRTISGLNTTPYGQDPVFKHVEIVTEYRRDVWITFAPKHGIVLRKIDNPYNNYQLPITMLRYYTIDDDLYGISEIEPVKPLQKAINAILSQYVDEINQKLYTPIAIGPGVRQQTLEWGKGARWLMNNPMSDFRLVESQSNAAAYFNNTYSALVAAMMNAIGETSLGVSNIDRFQSGKTATEVKQLLQQRNARDNFNQMFLAESIERQMVLWYSMNQKFLFADPDKKHFIMRVVGKDAMEYFGQEMGGYGLTGMGAETAAGQDDPEILKKASPEQFGMPKRSVPMPTEEGGTELKPKFTAHGNMGTLIVEPEDVMGTYDYIADVRAMSLNAGADEKAARDRAMTALLANPAVVTLLAQDKTRPKFKQLFVAWLEDAGFKDAEKFFADITPEDQQGGMPGQPPGPGAGMSGGSMPPEKPQPGAPNPGAPLPGQPPFNQVNTNNVNQPFLARQLAGPTAPPQRGPFGGNYGQPT